MGTTTTPERHDFLEEGATYSWTEGTKCGRADCRLDEHDKVHDPEVKVTHVVIGQCVYGNGADLAQAKANFRRQGGRLGKYHVIYEFPEGVTYLGVTGMGSVTWRYDTEERVQPVTTEVNDGKF